MRAERIKKIPGRAADLEHVVGVVKVGQHEREPALRLAAIGFEMRIRRLPAGSRSAGHVGFELPRVERLLLLLRHDREHVNDPTAPAGVDGRIRGFGHITAHQRVIAGATESACRASDTSHVSNSKTVALLNTWRRRSIAAARRYTAGNRWRSIRVSSTPNPAW